MQEKPKNRKMQKKVIFFLFFWNVSIAYNVIQYTKTIVVPKEDVEVGYVKCAGAKPL